MCIESIGTKECDGLLGERLTISVHQHEHV